MPFFTKEGAYKFPEIAGAECARCIWNPGSDEVSLVNKSIQNCWGVGAALLQSRNGISVPPTRARMFRVVCL